MKGLSTSISAYVLTVKRTTSRARTKRSKRTFLYDEQCTKTYLFVSVYGIVQYTLRCPMLGGLSVENLNNCCSIN